MNKGVLYGLLAAVLFGASTPFAKVLVAQVPPVMLAGLLYLGSGVGLLGWFMLRRMAGGARIAGAPAALSRRDLPWLAGAIFAGGVAAPVLLMIGLATTAGSTAALLLNLETVLTALLAWFVFREHFDGRLVFGMALIVIAGALLAVDRSSAFGASWGAVMIIGACLGWAIDNNLTRKVAASDPTQIAGLKGLVAGAINVGAAIWVGAPAPSAGAILAAASIGLVGYGVSLVLFVLALRHLGAARTGAYFSTAPFAGAALALPLLQEAPPPVFWMAAALMAVGVWLHLSERHEHAHTHEGLRHNHSHKHDEHHRHAHEFPWNEAEAHAHEHGHGPFRHRHAHFPDIHHRHDH